MITKDLFFLTEILHVTKLIKYKTVTCQKDKKMIYLNVNL